MHSSKPLDFAPRAVGPVERFHAGQHPELLHSISLSILPFKRILRIALQGTSPPRAETRRALPISAGSMPDLESEGLASFALCLSFLICKVNKTEFTQGWLHGVQLVQSHRTPSLQQPSPWFNALLSLS